MESTISCPHSMSRYTWKIRGKGGLSFELDMWAGRKGRGSICKPERESAEHSRQRKRSRKREQVSGNQNFLRLNAAPRCVHRNRKGRLWPTWPPSRKQRRQNTDLHFRSILVYVLKRRIRDRKDGKGQTTHLHEVVTKGMKTESLLHATCSISL